MATATLINPINPNNSYQSYHTSSYSSSSSYGLPSQPSSSSSHMHGMISPVESRRTSDESDMPHRQSLPSIQEVIQSAKGSTSTACRSSR